MKARIKPLLVIAGTAIALVAASQSVNPLPAKGIEKVQSSSCYSEEDVGFLMRANHWSRPEAVEVLELSCLALDPQQ